MNSRQPGDEEVGPLIETSTATGEEPVITKAIRVPVVNPPLPEPIRVLDLPIEEPVIPPKPSRFRKRKTRMVPRDSGSPE